MRLFVIPLVLLFIAASELAAAPRVGMLLKDRSPFWVAAEAGAQDSAKEAGVELIVKAPTRVNATNQQTLMLDSLLKEKLDVLIIAPLSPTLLNDRLKAGKAAGMKIIVLDSEISEEIADVFVGYNQAEMAETAARYAAKMVNDGEGVGILRTNAVDTMGVREKTFVAAFKAAQPNAIFYSDVFAGGNGDDHQQSILMLEKHPQMSAVCTLFTRTSLAMSKALGEKKLAGKIMHFGFGTGLPEEVANAIRGGAMQMWVAQQPKLIGVKAIESATALLGGKPLPATMDVPYTIVSKANIDQPEVRAIAP